MQPSTPNERDATAKPPASPRLSARTALKALVSVALTSAVFYLVLSRSDIPSFDAFLSHFSARLFLVVIVLSIFATALAVWRLKLIAQDLGYRLSIRDSVAALSLGLLAGTMFFQLIGQLMARGALLARRGMPVAATITLTIYERAAAAGVSFLMAIAGGWYVFGRVTLDIDNGGLVFLNIIAGLTLATVAGGWLAWGSKALSAAAQNLNGAFLMPIARNVLISATIQLVTMAAYVAASHVLAPSVPLLDLAAASAIVMLAAALPISLAGWGVRELSAVLALGAVGVPTDAALMVAVLIGVTSLLVVGGFAVSSFWSGNPEIPISGKHANSETDYATVLAWVIPILAATAVFFQLYIPVGKGELNVNLADPLAILGGALFLVSAVAYTRQWPTWRLPGLNAHFLAITGVLTLALLHGAILFGWTPWALTNRFTGWFVLLSYVATGAMIVQRAGEDGITTLLRTFAAVACAIIVLDLFLIVLTSFDVNVPHALLYLRIAGFSQNPNAFAFQILLAVCASTAADFRPKIAVWVTAICLCGIWFSSSRAVFLALPFVIAFAMYTHLMPARRLIASVALATGIVMLIAFLPTMSSIVVGLMTVAKVAVVAVLLQANYDFLWILNHTVGYPTSLPPIPIWPEISFPSIRGPSFRYSNITEQLGSGSGTESSDSERVASLKGALDIFLTNPIFGGGLGAFVVMHLREFGKLLVIHSTPAWLLAETGIVGFVVIAAPFIRVAIVEFKRAMQSDSIAAFLILILLAMGSVSLVHELFYQRGFWFLLGAAMAMLPLAAPKPASHQTGA